MIEFEQFEVQSARFRQVSSLDCLAHRRDTPRRQIAHRIHETGGADYQHRQTERLETAEYAKVLPQQNKGFSEELQIVCGMFQADKIRQPLGNLSDSTWRN